MKAKLAIVAAVMTLLGCESTRANQPAARGSAHALGTIIIVTTTQDELNVDGDCSLREAMRAAETNLAVDACPAGLPQPDQDEVQIPSGTYLASVAGAGEDFSATGDYDIRQSIKVLGDCEAHPVIDMQGLDRVFHILGANSAAVVEIGCVDAKNACPNGGTCQSNVPVSIPVGGLFYYVTATASFYAHDFVIESSTARGGAGFALCTDLPVDVLVENFEIKNCTTGIGGGAVNGHIEYEMRNGFIHNNVSTWGMGAAIHQYNRHLTVIDTVIEANVASGAQGGGLAVVGPAQANASAQITMIGGALRDNVANSGGGNAYVNGGQGGTSIGSNQWCGGGGCKLVLQDVEVQDGTADSPTTAPAGNGGNLWANSTGAAPGYIELRGATAVTGGTDLSSPMAPDCSGDVRLYDQSSVGDPANCTISDFRTVCGNGIVDAGEDCDSTACCSAACVFSDLGTSCSDGEPCTAPDACDGAGACTPGGTSCGDGTLQSSCGEECDDGNALSNDGCRADCTAETCVAWQ